MITSSVAKRREAMLLPDSWATENTMKLEFTIPLCVASILLAGCTSLLGNDNPAKLGGPSQVTVPVGNNLAMPPDLQLATPGTGTAPGYDAADTPAPVKTAALAKPKVGSDSVYGDGSASAAPADVFEQYGISKTKPDGTPKTQAELSAELKLAVLRKKKQQNPSYGTIGNIGNIFNDQ
jgi:hypothetical protein